MDDPTTPLRLRIKLKTPRIDHDVAASIRALAEHKLQARGCSLRQALLIHKALPHLDRDVSRQQRTPVRHASMVFDCDDDETDAGCTQHKPQLRGARCEKRAHSAPSDADDAVDADLPVHLCRARRRLATDAPAGLISS
jgi:hypothetical protein